MHAVGCYSVVSWMKELNARGERALVDAERLAAMAQMVTGRPLLVHDQLVGAWQRVLFNQFHDSLGGTCTAEAHDALRELYGHALAIADEVTAKATQAIAARVDTWVPEASTADRYRSLRPYVEHYPVPVVVFNPLSWDVTVPIAMPHQAAAVTDDGSRPLAMQRVASGEGTRYPTTPWSGPSYLPAATASSGSTVRRWPTGPPAAPTRRRGWRPRPQVSATGWSKLLR